MLQPGEDPKIENVGTIKDPIWDFYIPRGFTGEHAVHVGPEDPVTFRNSHLDDADIQEAYKNAEQMIWVDTKNKADFDHLNAVYHAYKEAGGTALDQSKFAEAFANLTNASGYYTKTQVDDAISTAKTELETADTALEGQITTVTNQLNNKVDKVEGSGLISDTDLNQIRTNKSDIESLQTSVGGKQDELTPGNAVSITEENVIDVKLDPASNEALSKSAEGLKLDLSGVKGSTVKVGVAITGGAEIGADQTIAAGMQALSDSIQTAVSGGITSLTSPDETITVTGTGTSRGLAVNISKLVSTSSAIQIGEDGKLDMFWVEIE